MSDRVHVNRIKNRILDCHAEVLLGLRDESTISDFKEIKNLGAGSFGSINKVVHLKTKNTYAIKAIKKRNLNDYLKNTIKKEVEILQESDHPHILKSFDHFEDEDQVYIVIEYASNGSLREKLNKSPGKRISLEQIKPLFVQLVKAVKYLHGKKIIHRDIKTENILICENNTIKLIDFGTSNDSNDQRITKVGTPAYYAPEIVNDGKVQTNKLDIWCQGIVLYECLVGKTPFEDGDIKKNVLEKQPDFGVVFGIPPEAKNFIKKLLAKNPEKRPSIDQVMADDFLKDQNFKDYNRTQYDFKIDNVTRPKFTEEIDISEIMLRIRVHARGLYLTQDKINEFQIKPQAEGLPNPEVIRPNDNDPVKKKIREEIEQLNQDVENLNKTVASKKLIENQNQERNQNLQKQIDNMEDEIKRQKDTERVLKYQDKEYNRLDIEKMVEEKDKFTSYVLENDEKIEQKIRDISEQDKQILEYDQKLIQEEEVTKNLRSVTDENWDLEQSCIDLETKIEKSNTEYYKQYEINSTKVEKLLDDQKMLSDMLKNEEKQIDELESSSNASDLSTQRYLFDQRKQAIFQETVQNKYDKFKEQIHSSKKLENELQAFRKSNEALSKMISDIRIYKYNDHLSDLQNKNDKELRNHKTKLRDNNKQKKDDYENNYKTQMQELETQNDTKKSEIFDIEHKVNGLQCDIQNMEQKLAEIAAQRRQN